MSGNQTPWKRLTRPKYLLADRVPDGLELQEGGDVPRALSVRVPSHDPLDVLGRGAFEISRCAVGSGEVERVDVHVRREPRRELLGMAGQDVYRPARQVPRREGLRP